MGFEVGRQVVCVKGGWDTSHLELPITVPVVGNIYTIRAIRSLDHPTYIRYFGVNNFSIRLEEIVNPCVECNLFGGLVEPAFVVIGYNRQYHFRLVKKTDISVFTAMLNKTSKLEDA